MPTEDEATLTLTNRCIAAGGAAVVAATVVNPLDVIKVRCCDGVVLMRRQMQPATGLVGWGVMRWVVRGRAHAQHQPCEQRQHTRQTRIQAQAMASASGRAAAAASSGPADPASMVHTLYE